LHTLSIPPVLLQITRVALAALCLCALSSNGRALPNLARLEARYSDAIVRVIAEGGDAAQTGFLVAGDGIVLTAPAQKSAQVVIEFANGERRRGSVVAQDPFSDLAAIKITRLPKDRTFASLKLSDRGQIPDGPWLIGFGHGAGGQPRPSLGGLRKREGRFALLDLPVSAGAPVLALHHGEAEVVGVAVSTDGGHRSRAISVRKARALLHTMAPR